MDAAQLELYQGRAAAFKALWSQSDDVTIAGGFGGTIEKGWKAVGPRLDHSCVVGGIMATIMRRLWKGETVTHHGHVTVAQARLYSLPEQPPPIIGAALTNNKAYARLGYLTDRIGHRLSGSTNLERAIAWAVAELKSDGLDNVRPEKVMVPHWVRGEESLEITAPRSMKLPSAIESYCSPLISTFPAGRRLVIATPVLPIKEFIDVSAMV